MNERCADLELELTGFAAGELEPALADRVARHLAACAACRAELDRELRLRGALRTLPLAAAPAGLGALPPAAARPPRRLPLPPSLGGLAAAAVLVALLAGLPGGRPAGPGETPAAFTADQVAAARRDAAWTLVLAARILERTERNALADVFGQRLPRAVAESLGGPAPTPEGGQG